MRFSDTAKVTSSSGKGDLIIGKDRSAIGTGVERTTAVTPLWCTCHGTMGRTRGTHHVDHAVRRRRSVQVRAGSRLPSPTKLVATIA